MNRALVGAARFIALCAVVAALVTGSRAQAAPALQQAAPTLQQRMGYPASARLLMIHADDFGMSRSVDRAIEQALEHGWVTSASVMVPYTAHVQPRF